MQQDFNRWRTDDRRDCEFIGYDEYRTDGIHNHMQSLTGSKTGPFSSIAEFNHPRFKQRKNRGEVMLGDLLLQRSERSVVPASINFISGTSSYWVNYWGDYASLVEGLVPQDLSLEGDILRMSQIAYINAMGKTRSDQIMSGEILHDLSQTISMLRRPFQGAVKHLTKIRKLAKQLSGKSASSMLLASKNAWLEYRYGWKPLLLDANQVIKNVHKARTLLHQRLLVGRASVRGERSSQRTLTHTVTDAPLIVSWVVDLAGTGTQKIACSAGVLYQCLTGNPSEKLAQDFRLGSDSLLQTAWEVIPFSFVADWFFNVGAWLEAIVPNPNILIRGSWCTVRNERKFSFSSSNFHGRHAVDYDETGSFGSSHYSSVTLTRTTNPDFPTIPLPPPNFNFSSVTHAIDGVALFVPRIISALKDVRH